jgi:hypothetical protein
MKVGLLEQVQDGATVAAGALGDALFETTLWCCGAHLAGKTVSDQCCLYALGDVCVTWSCVRVTCL